MNDSDTPADNKQETEASAFPVAQPATPAKKQDDAPEKTANPPKDEQTPKPESVELKESINELSEFERKSLKISGDMRRIAWFAFWATLAAAIFVGVQIFELRDQNQISSSQSISSSASAMMSEINTKQQLSVAAKQLKAAQDQVDAINEQMREDQRAWVGIAPPVIIQENGQLKVIGSIVNSGGVKIFV